MGKGGRVEGRKKGKGCGLEKEEGEVLRVGRDGRIKGGKRGKG